MRATPNPRPLRGRVLLQQDPSKTRTGLIHAPQGSEEFPNTATVIAVGLDVEDVSVGDRVIFQRQPSSALATDRRVAEALGYGDWTDLIVLPIDCVLAVIEGEGDYS